MASLNDLEKGPWNQKNWHPSLRTGKLRFNIPDDMPLGDKKALILELIEKFPNNPGLKQIQVPGVAFTDPDNSNTWEADLASPILTLDQVKYIEFDPKADTSHSKNENTEAFRTFLGEKKVESEKNHPKQPAPQQKPQTTVRETLGAFGEGTMEVAEAVTELPVGVALSRWDDLLKKISQAETFDELAQNVLFQLLLLAPNALNDALVIVTGKFDEWTKNLEKKLDEAKKERLEALKKGLNKAKKEAESGNTQGALETTLLATLLGMSPEQRAAFLKNLQDNPDILKNNPDLQKALQNKDVQDLLKDVRKPMGNPHIEITGSGRPNYTKTVEMQDGSEHRFRLERNRVPATPPATGTVDNYTYQMDFLMDGKAAHLEHDPTGDGKYILTCDGNVTEYDLKTREVRTTDSHGTVTMSRDPEKAFQDISKQTEALKKQEEEFEKNLKTLDKRQQLVLYKREYFNPATTQDRKDEIIKKLKDDWGVTLGNPNNRADWNPELDKAKKERNALLNPPPPKPEKVLDEYPAVESHPYPTVDGGRPGHVTGFQVFNGRELMSDKTLGRHCTHTVREKMNEYASADIKEYPDGAFNLNIHDMEPAPLHDPGDHASHSGNRAFELKCHRNTSGNLEGTMTIIKDGVYYHCTLQNGNISECVHYDKNTGNAQRVTLSSPISITETDIRDTIAAFSTRVDPRESINDFRDPAGFPLVDKVRQAQADTDAEVTAGRGTNHTLSDERKAGLNSKINETTKKLGDQRQRVFNEKERLARIEDHVNRNDNEGI